MGAVALGSVVRKRCMSLGLMHEASKSHDLCGSWTCWSKLHRDWVHLSLKSSAKTLVRQW
eukprot:11715934-Karenia_brevis.AAC.1